MMYQQLFVAMASLFFVVPVLSMDSVVLPSDICVVLPSEIYKEALVPFIDHPCTANAFFSTCRSLCTMYGAKENPVHCWLLTHPEKCSLLPENTYHAALVHFSRQKNEHMVKLLIAYENDIQRKEREDICEFFGHIFILKKGIEEDCERVMLAYCGVLNGVMRNQSDVVKTYIARAMNKKMPQVLKIFIKNRVQLNSLFPTGKRSVKIYFSWAAEYNDLEMMELLKKVGASINVTGRNGNTLLHVAVQKRNGLHLIKLLIKYGADVNKKNNLKLTPFDYAASGEIRKLLIERGADVSWHERVACFFLNN